MLLAAFNAHPGAPNPKQLAGAQRNFINDLNILVGRSLDIGSVGAVAIFEPELGCFHVNTGMMPRNKCIVVEADVVIVVAAYRYHPATIFHLTVALFDTAPQQRPIVHAAHYHDIEFLAHEKTAPAMLYSIT
jgi:hypothetical protein